MAKGDQSDFHSRLKTLLPVTWFAEHSPVLSYTLSACAKTLSWCYSLYLYSRKQTRISTGTDGWLDMTAYDFFGGNLRRPAGMPDDVFRKQIKNSLFRSRGTRMAVTEVLEDLTGTTPKIIEPMHPEDTGVYGGPGGGYGVAGAYGSYLLPYQAFVIAYRPEGANVPMVAGYQVETAGYGCPSQGEYVSGDSLRGTVTDAQIYAAVAAVKMEGTLVWVKLV